MRLSVARGRRAGGLALLVTAASITGCGGVSQPRHVRGAPASASGPSRAQERDPEAGSLSALSPSQLQHDVSSALGSVAARFGTVQLALLADWWPEPLVMGQDATSRMRLWSLSKPVVALALLRARELQGQSLDDLDPYLEQALERSDNCAMRELTLDLQHATGSMSGARDAITEVVELSGGSLDVRPIQEDRKGGVCLSGGDAELSAGFSDRLALLVGTARWRIVDAVRFVSGLVKGAADVRGDPSASEIVLRLMREPKLVDEEPMAGALKAPPDWGAGEVFSEPCWHLAYKAGWGGAQAHIAWLGAQMGVLALRGRRSIAFAVAVHPYVQPPDDDPGETDVPRATRHVLEVLRGALERSGLSACARSTPRPPSNAP